MPIVYVTTNKINGKKYLGKSAHGRPGYLGSGIAIQNAIRKYGKENFSRETVAYSDSLIEVAKIERQLSLEWKVVESNNWYNLKIGGVGGSSPGAKRTEETKQRISRSKKGQIAWNKGLAGTEKVKHREETKIKISQSNIGKIGKSGDSHSSSKWVTFTSPDNQDFTVRGIRKFCRDKNLNYNNIISFLRRGVLSKEQGWTVRYA